MDGICVCVCVGRGGVFLDVLALKSHVLAYEICTVNACNNSADAQTLILKFG